MNQLKVNLGFELAPMQPPFVTQFVITDFLESWFTMTVPFNLMATPSMGYWDFIGVRKSCTVARKKYVCGQFLQAPEHQSGDVSAYLPDLWTPKLPTREICEGNIDECKETSLIGSVGLRC